MTHDTSPRSLSSGSLLTPTPSHLDRYGSWRLSSQSAVSSASSTIVGVAPVSFTLTSSSFNSCEPFKDGEPVSTPLQRLGSIMPVKSVSPIKSKGLAAYNTFSIHSSKIEHDKSEGLSGFLEYRKRNGTWRPFLFQTIGHQLVLYRVHSTHQVMVMSTDLHCASEITLDDDGAKNRDDTRLLRLGINGTTITLRAVTHRAAVYWVNGLQRIRDGIPLQIVSDPPCTESEDEIFNEIDRILFLRECPPPSPSTTLCGLCTLAREPERLTAGMLLEAKLLNREALAGCKIC